MNSHTIILAVFLVSTLLADPTIAPTDMHSLSRNRNQVTEAHNTYLIDASGEEMKQVKVDTKDGKLVLKPNRVYRRFLNITNTWVYDITDDKAEFPAFRRLLVPTSTEPNGPKTDLPGAWMGAPGKVAFKFLGPPKKGPEQWAKIPIDQASRQYVFLNYRDPKGEPTISYHAHTTLFDKES